LGAGGEGSGSDYEDDFGGYDLLGSGPPRGGPPPPGGFSGFGGMQ